MGIFKEQMIKLCELRDKQTKLDIFNYGIYLTPEIDEFLNSCYLYNTSKISIKRKKDLRKRVYISIKIQE